jgi:hypothetical protein
MQEQQRAAAEGGQASEGEGLVKKNVGGNVGENVDLLGNLEVVVLDEVDRMLDSLGKYATDRDKMQRRRHPKKVYADVC